MPQLIDKIKALIALEGAISIDKFMEIALYDSKEGYYVSKNPIGCDGDFITAPEISQLFGESIGLWVYSCFQNLKCPEKFNLVEIGGGRGTLMNDVCRTIDGLGLKNKYQISFIDSNHKLRAQQIEKLKPKNPIGYNSISEFKINNDPIIIIANEFLDCLPIKQFIMTQTGLRERLVFNQDDKLVFGFGPVISNDSKLKNGEIIETCPSLNSVINIICNHFKANNGAVLFADYGHMGDENYSSLQALKNHKKTDIFENIGNSDLTAHVNFGLVADIGKNFGAQISGPITQGEFLKLLGIELRANQLIKANTYKKEEILEQLNRLIDENQMGNLFKILALEFF